MAALYFSALIAFQIYQTLNLSQYRLNKTTLILISIGAIICALINSVIPIIANEYGESGYKCWIFNSSQSRKRRDISFAYQMSLEYVQVLVICMFNIILYVRIYRRTINSTSSSSSSSEQISNIAKRAKRSIVRLQYYPGKLSEQC